VEAAKSVIKNAGQLTLAIIVSNNQCRSARPKSCRGVKNVQQLIIGIGIMTNCNLNILHEFYENDMKILFCDNRFRAASCFGP